MYINKVDDVQISFKIFSSKKDKFCLNKKKKISKGHREKEGMRANR